MSGWLLDQLPRVMAEDPVLSGFVLALEQVADTVRDRAASMEQQVDVDLATPDVLRFLAAWLGEDLEPRGAGERERELVRVIGRTLAWRGTRHGLEAVLSAATGSRVLVEDQGGIFGQRDTVPPPDSAVVVRLDSAGGLEGQQVRAFAQAELPVGARLQLEIRFPTVRQARDVDR